MSVDRETMTLRKAELQISSEFSNVINVAQAAQGNSSNLRNISDLYALF